MDRCHNTHRHASWQRSSGPRRHRHRAAHGRDDLGYGCVAPGRHDVGAGDTRDEAELLDRLDADFAAFRRRVLGLQAGHYDIRNDGSEQVAAHPRGVPCPK